MNLIEIKDLYENKENFIDKEIEVGGWVRSIRDSKTFGFIVLNDGTCFKPLQVPALTVFHGARRTMWSSSSLAITKSM